ncbi:MAG: hypothetical protein JNL21_18095 [Myxococcales bacterium]|nr:hypothetical protein [Myxococcales bacterium]
MSSRTLSGIAAVLVALAVSAGCDAPSSSVDPNDLRGVFDKDAGASASASASAAAKPRASASAAPPAPTERAPSDPGCVAARGAPAEAQRVAGRPACRGAEVREWRDPTGAPRYGCLYTPSDLSKRGELPLLVFFHGTGPGLDDPSSIAKLTDLRKHQDSADLTREGRPGFLVLGVQGRALGGGGLSFDTDHTAPDNVDRVVVDHFVDELLERKIVDARRIYAVGMGKGGEMAATYTMLRADRVAAFAAFAPLTPSAEWICPGPPPPGLVLYRACDKIAPCEAVESWLLARDGQRAETRRVRLGDAGLEEPSCTVRNKCTPKKAEANHHRWPKGKEKDVLGFLGGYVLKAP